MSEDVSILAEIDDALRADKAHKFWMQYGKLVLAVCVGIVVVTGISAYWKNHLHEQNVAETHVMLEADSATSDKRYTDAISMLQANKNWSGNNAATVKLQTAEIYLKAGQRDKAIAALKEVVASTAVNDAVHDSAALRLFSLTGEGDLNTAADQGRAFSPLAQQMKAASLLKAGKNKEAAEILKNVIATSSPFSSEHMSAMELLPLTGESAQ